MTAPPLPSATSAAGPVPAAPTVPQGASRAQLHKVAQQFEALLVRQMLSAARSDGIGDALGGSGAMDNFRAMQDERFAEVAAQRGSFGLGRMIETRLAARLGTPAAEG